MGAQKGQNLAQVGNTGADGPKKDRTTAVPTQPAAAAQEGETAKPPKRARVDGPADKQRKKLRLDEQVLVPKEKVPEDEAVVQPIDASIVKEDTADATPVPEAETKPL